MSGCGPTGVVLLSESGEPLQKSAFNQQVSVEPFTLFDHPGGKYGLDPRFWGDYSVNGGSITEATGKSGFQLDVGTTSGDIARACTDSFLNYQAGNGGFFGVTGHLLSATTPDANREIIMGQFDPFDDIGIGFGFQGTDFGVFRSTDDASVLSAIAALTDAEIQAVYPNSGWLAEHYQRFVPQTSFNVDKLDGTGPSGVSLSPMDMGSAIMEAQYQWYGVGGIEWYINKVLVHKIQHAGVLAGPYMTTAVLPMSISMNNTGTCSNAGSMLFICGSIKSQGGFQPQTIGLSAPQTLTSQSVSGGPVPLVAIRPKLTLNSVTNRIRALGTAAEASSDTNGDYALQVFQGGTLSGGANVWTSAAADSGFEYNTDHTTLTGGELIAQTIFSVTNQSGTQSRRVDLTKEFAPLGRQLRLSADGLTQEILTVTLTKLGGGSTTSYGTLSWSEIR